MSGAFAVARGLWRSAWNEVSGPGVAGVLSRGAASSLVFAGAGQLVGLGATMVLARLLGTVEWGLYSYAWTVINVTVIVTRLGLETVEIRYVAEYRVTREWGRLKGLLAFCDRVVWMVAALVAGLCALVVWVLASRLEPGLAMVLWVSFLVLPPFAILGLRAGTLQGFKRVILARLPEVFIRPLGTALLGGAAFLLSGRLEAVEAMGATLAAMVAAVAFGSWQLARMRPRELAEAEPEELGREWLATGRPLLLVAGMRHLLGHADILLVGMILGTTEAGIYSVASRLSNLVTYGQNAFNNIGAPLIAELHAEGGKSRLQRMVTWASWGSTLFALAAAVVLVVFGKWLLGWYGQDFTGAWRVLVILAAGGLVNAAAGPVGYLLNMTGHQDVNAKILAWVMVANLLLNVPAIHFYGVVGSAITTSVLVAGKNLVTCWVVRHRLGIQSSILGSWERP